MTKLSKIAEEVWSVLQTINVVTSKLCELATAGEYTKVAGLLQEREHLIANAKRAHDKLMNGVEDKVEKGEVHQTLRPLMDQIRDSDNRLLEILQRQKDIVVGKLQETQRQQSIHAYTQYDALMTVNKILGSGFVSDPVKIKKEKEAELAKSAKKDTAEVSDEAKLLFESERAKKIRDIEEKIANGYYLRREVTEKVADSMLRSLSKTPPTE